MVRTGQDAIDYARGRVGPKAMPESGYCLAFVRECFAVAAYYGSAIDAARGSNYQHVDDRNVPPAVPVYFRSPSQYDHVAFMGEPGEIITTFNDDVKRYVSSSTSAAIDAVCRDFDATYAGWAEDVNEVYVYEPAGPGPGPEPPPPLLLELGEDRMELIRVIEDGRIFAVGTYQYTQVPDMTQFGALSTIWGTYTDVTVYDAQRINNQVLLNLSDLAQAMKNLGIAHE